MMTTAQQNQKKAIILLSGGLDSATCLAEASSAGWQLYALSFQYGQRSSSELGAAARLAQHYHALSHQVVNLSLGQWGGSALTDSRLAVPETAQPGIPITYVPARNTLFLAHALALAEVVSANDIFIGVNAVDYSGYPDCRPEFIAAFEKMAQLATRVGVEGAVMRIHTPLMQLSKAEIIRKGLALGVDYAMTVSCYQADANGHACGRCDSCRLRHQGFVDLGVADPTLYQQTR
jgi:7-cyano-7-deazaguanine synthase